MRSAVLHLMQKAAGTRFWSLYREMRALDAATLAGRTESYAKIDAVQKERLATMLFHAASRVPLWQEVFAEAGIDPKSISPENAREILGRLPSTSKDSYQSGFPEHVTSSGTREQWKYAHSAGTTDRLTLVNDFTRRDIARAVQLRTLLQVCHRDLGASIVDLPPSACNVVCGLSDPGPQNLLPYCWWAWRKGLLFQSDTKSHIRGRMERRFVLDRTTLPPLDPQPWDRLVTELDDRLDAILAAKPQVLSGLPVFLVWLAHRAKQRQLTFKNLKAVTPFGGLMSAAMADRVQDGFGVPFVDVYGTGEVGALACQMRGQQKMSIFHDLFVVEILDEQDRPLEPGNVGRVVVTDLTNMAMPIIRYGIGDVGELVGANPNQPLDSKLVIHGRIQEQLASPDGSKVQCRQMLDALFCHPGVMNGRIEELSGGRYLAKVLLDPDANSTDVCSQVEAKLTEVFGADSQIKVRPARVIQPEGSGKFRFGFPAASSTSEPSGQLV